MNSYKFALMGIVTSLGVGAFTLPTEAASLKPKSESSEPVAQIRHNNGSRIALNGELLPFASDFFEVHPGDTIEINQGFTDFTLNSNDLADELLWDIQLFPGDSTLSFNLEEFFISTEENVTEVTPLPSGDGQVIAYGFDETNPVPVVLRALPTEPEHIPEPAAGIGMVIAAGFAYCLKTNCQRES